MLDRHLIAQTNPQANPHNIVLWKDYRITVLQDRLFRIEKSSNEKFHDKATQTVWFRNMPPQCFSVVKTQDRRESGKYRLASLNGVIQMKTADVGCKQ